jgi:hypothetical protein
MDGSYEEMLTGWACSTFHGSDPPGMFVGDNVFSIQAIHDTHRKCNFVSLRAIRYLRRLSDFRQSCLGFDVR